jgi:hypothetical protein
LGPITDHKRDVGGRKHAAHRLSRSSPPST